MRALKILLVNLAVSAVMLVAVEGLLVVMNIPTIGQLASKGGNRKLDAIELDQLEIQLYDSFTTGPDAIFRANKNASPGTLESWSENGVVINQEGFRGTEFAPVDDKAPTLLLIGDSFTWGSTARPITNSFADLLQKMGYHVYNAGIPGTDPGQYGRVAEKYIPLLKPESVVLCLYEGNDFAGRPMPALPDHPLQYVTSAGFIKGFDIHGRYFKNGIEAIDYFRAAVCGQPRTVTEWIHYHTRFGRALDRLILGPGPFARTMPDRQWIRKEVLRIAEICRASGADFQVAVVPALRAKQSYIVGREYMHLLQGVPVIRPEELTKEDYREAPDNHFNNRGHRRFAAFLANDLVKRGHAPGVTGRRPVSGTVPAGK